MPCLDCKAFFASRGDEGDLSVANPMSFSQWSSWLPSSRHPCPSHNSWPLSLLSRGHSINIGCKVPDLACRSWAVITPAYEYCSTGHQWDFFQGTSELREWV